MCTPARVQPLKSTTSVSCMAAPLLFAEAAASMCCPAMLVEEVFIGSTHVLPTRAWVCPAFAANITHRMPTCKYKQPVGICITSTTTRRQVQHAGIVVSADEGLQLPPYPEPPLLPGLSWHTACAFQQGWGQSQPQAALGWRCAALAGASSHNGQRHTARGSMHLGQAAGHGAATPSLLCKRSMSHHATAAHPLWQTLCHCMLCACLPCSTSGLLTQAPAQSHPSRQRPTTQSAALANLAHCRH